MHNTGNPLGSKDILDLYDNSENIDYFVNSQQDEVPDRFGTKRLTLAGLIKRSMALRNEINDFSGALTFRPEWSDVPMNVSEGVGGEGGALNLQAEALGNRSEINKVTSREALRRSYAEAGYHLVSGSFEAGGTLVNTNDVLLQESTGKAFSGPAGDVAAGTNPTLPGSGYASVSNVVLRNDLASAGGAELVGFQQSGTGAVVRTANSKLREIVSVKDFGAVGDGVANDTVAINKASSAAAVKGGSVLFPLEKHNFTFTKPAYNVTWKFDTEITRDKIGGTNANVRYKTAELSYLDGPHPTNQLHAKQLRAMAKGSNAIGAQYADYTLGLTIEKENWSNANAIAGEINALTITLRNGAATGDPVKTGGAAILADVGQIAGSGYVQLLEAVNNVFDRTTLAITKQTNIQMLGIDEKQGVSLGLLLNSQVGAQSSAIRIQNTPGTPGWGKALENIKDGNQNFVITDDADFRFHKTKTMFLKQESDTNDIIITNESGAEVVRFTSDSAIVQSKTVTNAVSGAAYTLLDSDRDKIKSLFHSAAITCTLPNTTPAGYRFRILQRDAAAQITFVPAAGAILRNVDGHTKTKGMHAIVELIVTSNSAGNNAVWYLTGSTGA